MFLPLCLLISKKIIETEKFSLFRFFLFHKYTVASYPDPAKILYYLKNYIFICENKRYFLRQSVPVKLLVPQNKLLIIEAQNIAKFYVYAKLCL